MKRKSMIVYLGQNWVKYFNFASTQAGYFPDLDMHKNKVDPDDKKVCITIEELKG